MNASDISGVDTCVQVVQTLAHFLWQGCVIAGVFFVANRSMRRSPAARYFVGCAALLLMVACLPVTWAALRNQQPEAVNEIVVTRAGPARVTSGRAATENAAAVVPSRGSAQVVELSESHESLALVPTQDFWQWASPYVAGLYMLGVVSMFVRLGLALGGGRRLRRCSARVSDAAILGIAKRKAARLGLRAAPAIAQCERIAVPIIVGVIMPTILLPVCILSELSLTQVEAVLAHELAHIRRWDHVANLVQRIIESLLFFHPAVWYVSHRVSSDRESCCDDMVLAQGIEATSYAELLVRVSELSQAWKAPSAATLAATGHRSSRLRERVLRLLGDAPAHPFRLSGAAAVAGVAAALFVVVLSFTSIAGLAESGFADIDVDGTPAAYEKEVRVADARHSVQAGKDEAERVRLLDEQVAAIKLDPSAVKSIRERYHDPDLRLAAMYDSELNGGVRLDGGQAKAEHYYLAYLPRVKNSAERCCIYSQLSVLFSTNWHPEMGESPDYPKSRRYAAEAIKAEPHRVGKATIRARARVRNGPDMSSEELFDGRLVLYKWLASWDETNTRKNWLPLRSEANNPDRHLRAFRNLLESVRQSERNNLLGSGGKQPQARLLRVVREAPGTEAAKIAEQKLEELWGEAVDGVQAMLIVERRDWDFGDQPGLKAMIRNRGDTEYEVAQAQQLCELEVDGRLYRWVGAVRVRSSHFPPRRTFEDIPITLDNHWQDKESGKPLVLEAGRYKLRLAFLPQQRVGADPIRVVSNRVEVRVEPAKQ